MHPLHEAMEFLEKLRRRGVRRRGTMDFQGRVRFSSRFAEQGRESCGIPEGSVK